jgi:hypothetical protein
LEILAGLALVLLAGEILARGQQPQPGGSAPDAGVLDGGAPLAADAGADAGASGVSSDAGAADAAPGGWLPPPPVVVPEPVGPRYDDDAALPAHAAPVASYTWRVSLDPVKHELSGKGQIVWKNASSVPQRELWLHLYLNAFKNEGTIMLRTPASGFRGAQPLSDWGWISLRRLHARELDADLLATADKHSPGEPGDETDIRVPLPREVAPGATLTLDVEFEAHLPSVTIRTGWSGTFHMVAQWFPKLARLDPDGAWAHFPFHRFSEFSANFGSYDVTIDVPEAYVVGATGRLDSESRADGKVTRRYLQEDVHDFAFTAWDRFQDRSETMEGVQVRCLYPPGYDAAARVQMDVVRKSLAHFNAAFGRYPYGTLTVVHPPDSAVEAGGMEYPTLITTGGAWWAVHSGTRPVEIVAVHELGHQWFYGMVATDEMRFPFLDEGINSWAEVDAMEAIFPRTSAASLPGLRLGLDAVYRGFSLAVARDEVIARSAPEFPRGIDYGALVYARTAMVLQSLGNVYGQAELRKAVGRYARRYRFEHPRPEHFIAALGDVLGAEAAAAASSALLQGGWVDYAVEEATTWPTTGTRGLFGDPPTEKVDSATHAPWSGQAVLRRHGAVALPVDVELVGSDGTRQRTRWEAGEATLRVQWSGTSALGWVVVDPEHRVLLDLDLANNGRAVERAGTTLRALDRASFFAGALLHAVMP